MGCEMFAKIVKIRKRTILQPLFSCKLQKSKIEAVLLRLSVVIVKKKLVSDIISFFTSHKEDMKVKNKKEGHGKSYKV